MRSKFSFLRATRSTQNPTDRQYQLLERRDLLATLVTFNSLTGELAIDLTDNNDVAIVDVDGGNISVNGSVDINTNLAGVQSAAADDVRRIAVTGDVTSTGQRIELNGDMSNDAGRALETVDINAVNEVLINGDYQLSDRFDVRLVGDGGGLTDDPAARLRVAGETDIRANNNFVELNSGLNDFVGAVTASNTDGHNMLFVDANDFTLGDVAASSDFQVFAIGNINDATDANVLVEGVGRFNGASVVFGNDAGDSINFGGFQAISTGDVELTESSAVQLNGIEAVNLTVNTTDGIFDTRTSTITVTGVATFNGDARVRIGENGTDTFNAGSVTFNSSGHVHIWENSGLNLVGANTALTLSLFSSGDLTDDDTASVNVTNLVGLEAQNVMLGDTATDQFNAGALHFFTPGEFSVSEDSDMHFTETKNRAASFVVESTGVITDAIDAQIEITGLSQFTAASVNVGNESTDVFNSGSISFNTTGQFRIEENSATTITGNNSAGNSDITSFGSIVMGLDLGGDAPEINVDTLSVWNGLSIVLGNIENDSVNLGGLQFISPGNVDVAEDSDIVLSQSSNANGATLSSTGSIFDADGTSVSVVSTTTLTATDVTLGDAASDSFSTELLTVQATGDVMITEQTGITLAGINRAANMALTSSGNIIDTPTADTVVTGNLALSGALLNLGTEASDTLTMGSLTVNSTGNTNVTADSDIQLIGSSTVGGILLLTADGNITDSGAARTEVTQRAILEGIDIIIGDLADDCFDIVNGGATNLFVTATGTNDVTVECFE